MTHQREVSGGTLSTSTLIYRALSTTSALSQSGAVRAGQTAETATYFNARQQLRVPPELANSVFQGFAEQRTRLVTERLPKESMARWSDDEVSEGATLDLMLYLRDVLFRGAAELLPQFPRCAIFKTHAFSSACFRQWAAEALNEVKEVEEKHVQAQARQHGKPALSPALKSAIFRMEKQQSRLLELVNLRWVFLC